MITQFLLWRVLMTVFWATTWTWSFSLIPHFHHMHHHIVDQRTTDFTTIPMTNRPLRFFSNTRLYATKHLTLRDTIDHIKETLFLSEILGEYVDIHEETSRGRGQTCLCPFHNDRNPSMHINDDKGLYYCFSCGAGGDVFHFVQQQEQCTFVEAVQHVVSLAQLNITIAHIDGHGQPLTDEQRRIEEANQRVEAEILQRKNRQERILLLAASYYTAKMMGDDPAARMAKRHILSRRLRPETAFRFQIGYAPHHPAYRERISTSNRPWATGRGEHLTGRGEHLTGELTERVVNSSHPFSLTYNLTMMGFEESELVEAGLTVDAQSNYGRGENLTGDLTGARYRYYDRFRGRLMVPIRNEQGVVVAFGGRALDIPSQISSQSSSQILGVSDSSSAHITALRTLAEAAKISTTGRARVTLERGVSLTGELTDNLTGSVDMGNTVATDVGIGSSGTSAGSGTVNSDTTVASGSSVGGGSGNPTAAKYLNSPESSLFKKGATLFGMDLARPHIMINKQVVMVEGYFDVIAMHDVGVGHAVGSLGTAITKSQLDLAAKWTHSSIVNTPVKSNGRDDDLTGPVKSLGNAPVKSPALVLLMDDDKAGIAAVQRLATKLLPDWCQQKNQGQGQQGQGQGPGLGQLKGQGQGQDMGQGSMTEVRVASLRLASVAAAMLMQQRQQQIQLLEEEEEEEEEERENVDNDDDDRQIKSQIKSLVPSPLRVVYYKDPSELCTAVNDKQIAQQAFQIAIDNAVGWQQWMVDEIINNALITLSPPPTTSTAATTLKTKKKSNRVGSGVQEQTGEEGADEAEQALMYIASQTLRRMRAQSNSQSDSELNDGDNGDSDNGDNDNGDNDDNTFGLPKKNLPPSRPQALIHLLTDPAAFSRIVAMVSNYLRTLPIAMDRTILACYAATTLTSGDSAVMKGQTSALRQQLERDLLLAVSGGVDTSTANVGTSGTGAATTAGYGTGTGATTGAGSSGAYTTTATSVPQKAPVSSSATTTTGSAIDSIPPTISTANGAIDSFMSASIMVPEQDRANVRTMDVITPTDKEKDQYQGQDRPVPRSWSPKHHSSPAIIAASTTTATSAIDYNHVLSPTSPHNNTVTSPITTAAATTTANDTIVSATADNSTATATIADTGAVSVSNTVPTVIPSVNTMFDDEGILLDIPYSTSRIDYTTTTTTTTSSLSSSYSSRSRASTRLWTPFSDQGQPTNMGQSTGTAAGQNSRTGAVQNSGMGAGQNSGTGAVQNSGMGAGQNSGTGAGQNVGTVDYFSQQMSLMSHGRVEACERALLGMYCHVPLLREYIREMMQQTVVGESGPGLAPGPGLASGAGLTSYEWLGRDHQALWEMFNQLDDHHLENGADWSPQHVLALVSALSPSLALAVSAVLEDTRPYLHNPSPLPPPPVPPTSVHTPVLPSVHTLVPVPLALSLQSSQSGGDNDIDNAATAATDATDGIAAAGDDDINEMDHHEFVTADDINDNDNDKDNLVDPLTLPLPSSPSPGASPSLGASLNRGPDAPLSPGLTPLPISVLKPLTSLRLDIQGAVRVLVEFSLRKAQMKLLHNNHDKDINSNDNHNNNNNNNNTGDGDGDGNDVDDNDDSNDDNANANGGSIHGDNIANTGISGNTGSGVEKGKGVGIEMIESLQSRILLFAQQRSHAMDREVNLYDKIKRDQLRDSARATAAAAAATAANHHHHNNQNSLSPSHGPGTDAGSDTSAGPHPSSSLGASSGPGTGSIVGSSFGVKPRPIRSYDFNFTEADAWVMSEGEFMDEAEHRSAVEAQSVVGGDHEYAGIQGVTFGLDDIYDEDNLGSNLRIGQQPRRGSGKQYLPRKQVPCGRGEIDGDGYSEIHMMKMKLDEEDRKKGLRKQEIAWLKNQSEGLNDRVEGQGVRSENTKGQTHSHSLPSSTGKNQNWNQNGSQKGHQKGKRKPGDEDDEDENEVVMMSIVNLVGGWEELGPPPVVRKEINEAREEEE